MLGIGRLNQQTCNGVFICLKIQYFVIHHAGFPHGTSVAYGHVSLRWLADLTLVPVEKPVFLFPKKVG